MAPALFKRGVPFATNEGGTTKVFSTLRPSGTEGFLLLAALLAREDRSWLMLHWAIGRLYDVLLPAIYRLRLLGWWVLRPITLGVRVLAIDGDQILLVRAHGRSQWHLPGGAVARNEPLADAARREVREETGCDIRIERLLGMYINMSEYKSDHVAIFVGQPLSALVPRLNLEIAEARYFPRSNLPASTDPSVLRRLADFEAERWGMHGPW